MKWEAKQNFATLLLNILILELTVEDIIDQTTVFFDANNWVVSTHYCIMYCLEYPW